MRIYIVGGPGSGKTTFADTLARRRHVPVLHLDEHFAKLFDYPQPGDNSSPPSVVRYRDALVAKWLGQGAWIIEGAEPPFIEAFAKASDLIIWCDVPFWLATTRILRRYATMDPALRDAVRPEFRLYKFLRALKQRYEADVSPPLSEWVRWTRGHVATRVADYPEKVLRLGGASGRTVRAVLVRST